MGVNDLLISLLNNDYKILAKLLAGRLNAIILLSIVTRQALCRGNQPQ